MSLLTKSLLKHNRKSRIPLEKGKFIGPYEIIDFLKEGSSSQIYLAKSQYLGEKVVIKAINKSRFQKNLDQLLLVTKQIEALKILKHRNIITLYEIYESPKYLYLITEYCSGKDLIEKIIRKKRFSEEEALLIFFQLLDAFTYMHKMKICHRNVRTEHILFDRNNRPKIVGFGYCSFYEKNKKIEGAFGSLCYTCPEIIDEQPYDPELADVWSLGVILYVLICGYLPFSDEDDDKNKILISEGKIDFPKEMSNKLKDLLRHMLDKNPSKRYNFQKIVKHPWIKPYSEIFFSQGINIYKTIYPVDDRILSIIKEFGFDKNVVKNDLIKNKFNKGTGLYKQIVRKLLDMKIKNISDLFCEEFNEYRDNEKNLYENGDKKYEEYIQEVLKKYNKKEEFVNKFIEREDQIATKLLEIKEQKEKEKEKKELNIINEETDKDKEDKEENINNNNNNNVEIVYNNDQEEDVDVIQQFKENQIKKRSSNNLNEDLTPDKYQYSINNEQKENESFMNKLLETKTSNTKENTDNNLYNSIVNTKFTLTKEPKNNNIKLTKTFRRTKTFFDRGSLYDDYLKRNHPENIRKTLMKNQNNQLCDIYEDKEIFEDIKEKEESENEKEEKKEEDKLKFSFDFEDDSEDNNQNEENENENDEEVIDVIDKDGDDKLFNLLNNDDNEEIKELKRLYYGDNLKESIRFIKKSKQ